METRGRRAARGEPAGCVEVAAPSLAEQPADVLALVGAELSDALTPGHLTALASTCGTLALALRAAVAELKETRRAVSALLRKCSNPRKTEYTLEQAASGGVDVIFGGSKGLDAADGQLMARWLLANPDPGPNRHPNRHPSPSPNPKQARWLFGNASFSVNNLWAYDNPGLGDAGVAALARAFQRRPQRANPNPSPNPNPNPNANPDPNPNQAAAGAQVPLAHGDEYGRRGRVCSGGCDARRCAAEAKPNPNPNPRPEPEPKPEPEP